MAMSEKARKARNAYLRKWRREHPEKMKKYNENHWEHVAERENVEETAGDD